MGEVFGAFATSGESISPEIVLIRLLAALVLGAIVAWIYVRTTENTFIGESFPTTLALLAVLIAMVTQVIGDNVARAFSLVGALSIVRFRTVVRDTKDTAYVIFAVVVGMAAGAQNWLVAVIGIAVIAVAVFYYAWHSGNAAEDDSIGYRLVLRVGLGNDLEQLAGELIARHFDSPKLRTISTVKQGTAIEYVYETRLRRGGSPEEFVKELNFVEGVQDVRIDRRTLSLE